MSTPGRAAVLRATVVLVAVALGIAALLVVGSRSQAPPSTEPASPTGATPGRTATPSPTAASSPTPGPSPSADPPLAGVRIVLDPGHNAGNAEAPGQISAPVDDGRGGVKACNTVGTATMSGYPEHAFTWDVARRTAALLGDAGADVVLTRGAEGVGPCVDERGQAPGEADADLMVSIHANGSENPAVRGFFVLVPEPPLNDAQGAPTRALAEELLDALAEAGFASSSAFPDGLVGRADLATLNHAERPAVMLELAEMRNPEEAALVQSEAGRARYAEAVAGGVIAWARPDP